MAVSWRSKQNWDIGSTVRVLSLELRITSCTAVYDNLPDIYELEALKPDRYGRLRRYSFIPHNGLERTY
jgi:hypothetical protein